MGMWGYDPWDNDEAADWFGDLFDTTKLRDRWLDGIQADPEDDGETVRAAAFVFIQFGRVYVWPQATLDSDRATTIAALTSIRNSDRFSEAPELVEAIDREIAALQTR
jgi:hypothetical protein